MTQEELEKIKVETLNQLGRTLTHEINQHLTVILGASSLFLSHLSEDDPNYDLLIMIQDAALQMTSIIRKLTRFIRCVTATYLNEELIDIDASVEKEKSSP